MTNTDSKSIDISPTASGLIEVYKRTAQVPDAALGAALLMEAAGFGDLQTSEYMATVDREAGEVTLRVISKMTDSTGAALDAEKYPAVRKFLAEFEVEDSRFWAMDLGPENKEDLCTSLEQDRLVGIVDEQEGGIFAYAFGNDEAMRIIQALEASPVNSTVVDADAIQMSEDFRGEDTTDGDHLFSHVSAAIEDHYTGERLGGTHLDAEQYPAILRALADEFERQHEATLRRAGEEGRP